jgi:hypothetical protein
VPIEKLQVMGVAVRDVGRGGELVVLLNGSYRLWLLVRNCRDCLHLYSYSTSLKAWVLVTVAVNDTALCAIVRLDMSGLTAPPGKRRLGLGCRPPEGGTVVVVVAGTVVDVDVDVVGVVVTVVVVGVDVVGVVVADVVDVDVVGVVVADVVVVTVVVGGVVVGGR